MKEIWKDVIGYEGYYRISNFGRVLSMSRIIIRKDNTQYPIKERILSCSLGADGYRQVTLRCNGAKQVRVHNLVATAFLGLPPAEHEVDHLDRDRSNNKVFNLEYKTPSDNQKNKGSNRGSSSKYKGVSFHKRQKKWSSQFKLNGKKYHVGIFFTELEAAEAYDSAVTYYNYTTNKDLGLY